MRASPLAIDLFCGLGGWTDGLLSEGWEVIGFDNERHEYDGHAYPAQLVVQDVTTLHGAQFRDAELIVASPPCFVADTLILTDRGFIPIPEVAVGDLVLTHRKRWRRVLRTGSTISSTLVASGYGGTLEGTTEHPIYARENEGGFSVWDKEQKAPVNVLKSLGAPAWTPLGEMEGRYWASPTDFESLPLPGLPSALQDSSEFWWIVGRWIGDGWVRLREGQGDEIAICCGRMEADELERNLAAFAPRQGKRAQIGELHWRRSEERTTTRFTAASNAFAQWLVQHFGRGAGDKALPAWALGMSTEHRKALLAGYVSADGSVAKNGEASTIRAGSVSRRLAMGVRLLAASLGHPSNLFHTPRPATAEIEGRTVNQRDTWTATWNPETSSNQLVDRDDGLQWGKVRNVAPAQSSARVWNIEVEEDNSYTANGIVVHNCQEYSYMAMPWGRAKQIARALRGEDDFPEGYKGSRTIAQLNRLFDACFRIQDEACEAAGRHIPLVVENVRGAQPWVGRAAWNYGSYYLWGDVPALMPVPTRRGMKGSVGTINGSGKFREQSSWDRPTKSSARKAASAMIAKIPFDLAQHIARVYRPSEREAPDARVHTR